MAVVVSEMTPKASHGLVVSCDVELLRDSVLKTALEEKVIPRFLDVAEGAQFIVDDRFLLEVFACVDAINTQ